MCGHEIKGSPELRTYFQVDYVATVDLDKPVQDCIQGPRPLDDLSPYTIFEVESGSRTLDQARFRYLIGRALTLENKPGCSARVGRTGLVILSVPKPVKLLEQGPYDFQQIAPWKYRTRVEGLPVCLILLRELQKVQGNKAFSLLQMLDPEPSRRMAIWNRLLVQKSPGQEDVERTMFRLDKETLMTVYEQIQNRCDARVDYFQNKMIDLEEENHGLKSTVMDLGIELMRLGKDAREVVQLTGLDPNTVAKLQENLS